MKNKGDGDDGTDVSDSEIREHMRVAKQEYRLAKACPDRDGTRERMHERKSTYYLLQGVVREDGEDSGLSSEDDEDSELSDRD